MHLTLSTTKADITPQENIDLSGFLLRQNPAVGVSDPLSIRWISLRDRGGQNVLIGAADVLSFSRQTFNKLRDEIAEAVGDGGAHVGLGTTHTHSAPAVVRLRNCGQKNLGYLRDLKAKVVSSATAAAGDAHKAVSRVRLGSVSCDLNFNRRHRDDIGKGPVDKELLTLSFEDERGNPLAMVVNYGCHPVVLGHENRHVSADYPGFLCSAIEERTGAACLFLNGACGDVNPRDEHHDDPAIARRMGEAMADEALASLANADELDPGELSWHSRKVKLPVHVPTSMEKVHERLDHLESRFGVSRDIFASRIARDEKLLASGRYPKVITVELSLLTLGSDAAILFVPGELFSSIGLRAKQMALPRKLLISAFSNGSVGYLCDRQAYADGGYEPYFANFFYDFPEFVPDVEDPLFAGIEALLNASAAKTHISAR